MRMYDIILKKRNGGELSEEEIRYFVDFVVNSNEEDYKITAFLMAVYFRGMTDRETVLLTDAMAKSGDTVDLSRFGSLSADKHSTGGVGDKTSLIVAPVAASAGCKIAKMSGRGLGHTGGTVDKLESIPGYRTSLTPEEFLGQVEKTGIAIIGQTGNLAPADKKLYSLRDVTATVDSIPLITSSIMSKKLAAGAKNIVLDVKYGSGAFMKTPDDAVVLAEKMVKIGKDCGRNIVAVITDMDKPLGKAVGNSLEICEAVNVLKGREKGELYEVSVELAANMISLVKNISFVEAKQIAFEEIESGRAFGKMLEWVSAQGGNADYLKDTSKFPEAVFRRNVICPYDGYISSVNAESVGRASVILGAGRNSKDDVIDFAAGIIINKNTGDAVNKGDVLFTLYTNRKEALAEAERMCLESVAFSENRPDTDPTVFRTVR